MKKEANVAATLVLLGEAWLWMGAVVALVFLTIGIDRIDEDARGAYVFRPLLIPGVLLIWPLVLWRWVQIERHGEITQKRYAPVRRAHGAVAALMSMVIVLLLIFGWSARQEWPANVAPIKLGTGAES